jgi:hypothetical protein
MKTLKWSDIPVEDVEQMLRDGAQGTGLTDFHFEDWLARYGIDAAFVMQAIVDIDRATTLVNERDHRLALRSALGFEGEGRTLTERRNKYLENADITYRTLVRHEVEGAGAAADILHRLEDVPVPEPTINERLDGIEGMLLAVLDTIGEEHAYFKDALIVPNDDENFLEVAIMEAIRAAVQRSVRAPSPGLRNLVKLANEAEPKQD